MGDEFDCDAKQARFNEPSDITIHPTSRLALIADTNNHCIKVFNLDTNIINKLSLNFAKYHSLKSFNIEVDVNSEKLITNETPKVSFFDSINVNLNLNFEDSISFNPNAPNLVEIKIPGNYFKTSIKIC